MDAPNVEIRDQKQNAAKQILVAMQKEHRGSRQRAGVGEQRPSAAFCWD